MTTRRVAVLGLGSIGSRHLRVLGGMPGVEPIGVPIRPRAIDGVRTAASLAEAADLGATACVVATNTARHVADAEAALGRGLDPLVEKPLAVDAGDARRLARGVAGVGRIFVGYDLRFSASLALFRDRVPALGRLHAVRVECQSFLPDWRPERPFRESYSADAREGGVLRDLSHDIDYAGWIFGWPDAVAARVLNFGRLGIDADETADLSWERPGGCVVSVRLDYLTRPSRRRMAAYGEHGTLEWDALTNSVTTSMAASDPVTETRVETRDGRLEAQDRAFLDARSEVCDDRLATFADGLRSLAICDAARRASATGRVEPVEYGL